MIIQYLDDRYCQEFKNIENLLLSYCDFPDDLLPDVLVINGLNEYFESKNCLIQYYFSKALSLLCETVEYISRRKKSKSLLYVSLVLYFIIQFPVQ